MPIPAKNPSLHGNVPDRCAVALILVDVINAFDFEGGEALLERALRAVRPIAALKKRAKALRIPVIYANDNFGRWRSDFRTLLAHCLRPKARGRAIAEALKPDEDDYFVLKPKYSAFHSTPLDVLLDHLGARTLILAGFAGDVCIVFSANDAFLRDMRLFVPRDAIASQTAAANRDALAHLRSLLKADTRQAARIDLRALKRGGRRKT